MRKDLESRIKQLEKKLKKGDGVLLVDAVPGGYQLPNGETVKSLDTLKSQYSIIIIDDLTENTESE